jgi:hypothetical protein
MVDDGIATVRLREAMKLSQPHGLRDPGSSLRRQVLPA